MKFKKKTINLVGFLGKVEVVGWGGKSSVIARTRGGSREERGGGEERVVARITARNR